MTACAATTSLKTAPGYEACDDGNNVNTDACLNACTIARCGDSVAQEGVEACDDGNEVNTDACLNDCTAAACGDDVLRTDIAEGQEGYEACDDGNCADTDGCRNSCVIARCGDGVVREGVEGCDDGNNVNTDVRLDAARWARCGDGVRRTDLAEGADGFEACDDGNQNNNDSCTNSCAAAPSGSQGNPGRTCNTLRQTGQTENRRYWIDPDGDGGANPFEVTCDMTTDGGGWRVVNTNYEVNTGGVTSGATGAAR